ncbi:hypothetical protein [Filifactor villosus]|uniref:Transposase n=1 Tax=Filifactor villosus TaxID=29374 RepID=A0ABV9QP04_9FIRM
MLTIITIKYIRELYFREEKSLSEIMKLTGRNYRTIKKYIEMEDFNEKEQPHNRTRKSDVIRPIIRQ